METKSSKKRSKDIWVNLLEDLKNPLPDGLEGGVWSYVSILPGGIWQEAKDETLVLKSYQKHKKDIWQKIDVKTILPNSKRANNIWSILEKQVEDVFSYEDEKEDIWEELDEETLVISRPKDILWQMPKIRDMEKFKPMKATGWAIKKLITAKGETYWVLKNLRKDAYLRLTEQQAYLWDLMDGSNTVKDLAVYMFLEYKTLSVGSLMGFVEQLHVNGFLVTEKVDIYDSVRQRLSRYNLLNLLKIIWQFFFQSEFSIKGIDKFYNAMYKLGGWLLFTRPALLFITIVSLAGLPAFIYITLQGEYSFLQGTGNSVGLGLVGLMISQTIVFFFHESAHALTTKHYGRKVKRGGAGLYMGMLTFFMDTTDIWMEPRKPRLAVTWAGPFSGFLLGSIASLVLLFIPSSTLTGVFYQFATLCYFISIINLNPLLKLDGYYLIMDWMEIPKLRERSFAFIRNGLRAKISGREKLTSEERVFAIFGTLAALWTVVFIFITIKLYGEKLINFFQSTLSG